MSIIFAPWEWHDDPNENFPYWRAPGGNAVGSLDLRSNTQIAIQNDPTPGFGLFVYDSPQVIAGSTALADDPQQQLSRVRRSAIETALGITLAETQFQRVVEELYSIHADPTGISRVKPSRTGLRLGHEIWLGSFGRILQSRFSQAHPSFQNTLAVRWAGYRRARAYAETLPIRARTDAIDSLKRQTGYDSRKLFGRDPARDINDLLPRLLPPEYQLDGWLEDDTSLAESFNTADSDTLGPDLTWTEIAGDWDIVSNTASARTVGVSSADNIARAETDLSSDDHYAEVVVTTLNVPATAGKDTGGAPAARMASASEELYFCDLNRDQDSTDSVRFWKLSAGSFTNLDTNRNVTITLPDTVRIETDGSTMKSFFNGGAEHNFTDASFTGSVRTGIWAFIASSESAGDVAVDDFAAADLAGGADVRNHIIPAYARINA